MEDLGFRFRVMCRVRVMVLGSGLRLGFKI